MERRKKQLLVLITIASLITISGIALAFNPNWFNFDDDQGGISSDAFKMTDEFLLKVLPEWFDASVKVTGSGYIGQEHTVEISIWHTRPENSIYEATGAFSLDLELPEGTIVEPITSGSFSDLRNYETHVNTPYTWTPSADAELYTIALVIDGVVWNELSEYTIISSAGDGGSISPLGAITVYEGDDQTFTITPDVGYELADLVIDETISVWSFGITDHTFYDVDTSYTIHATFSLIEYPITSTLMGSGTAGWALGESHSGDYSVELYALDGTTDWADFSIPVDIAIEDIYELKFWEKIDLLDASGWDVSVFLGVDCDDDGTFNGDIADWQIGPGTHTLAPLAGDSFVALYGWGGKTGGTFTPPVTNAGLSADVDWTLVETYNTETVGWFTPDDTGTGIAYFGSVQIGGFSDFQAWLDGVNDNGIIDVGDRVKVVKLVIGGLSWYIDEIGYIDDVTINGVTYDLEPT